MSYSIEYVDITSGLKIYAVLFNAFDLLEAFNPSNSSFETFNSQQSFSISLTENSNRSRYYFAEIEDTSAWQDTRGTDRSFQLEIWLQSGITPNRVSDRVLAIYNFFWDGNKEITLNDLTNADQIWNYENRDIDSVINNVEITDNSVTRIVDALNIPTTRPAVNGQRPRLLRNS